MRFSSPLDDVLRTSTHVRVLRALFEVPRGFGVSGREVARRAGVTHPSANKALGALEAQGMVGSRRALRSDEYTLNYDNVLTSAIAQVFLQEGRLREDLRGMLQARLQQLGVTRAFLFGSIARDETTAASDIDLAIEPPVFPPTTFSSELEALHDEVRRRYGNQLNVIFKQTPSTERSDAIWRRLLKESIPVFEEGR